MVSTLKQYTPLKRSLFLGRLTAKCCGTLVPKVLRAPCCGTIGTRFPGGSTRLTDGSSNTGKFKFEILASILMFTIS